ncbi:N-acetyltransferase [Puteibacter caeruleilacunae]|nr:N-acetyltransferase [Puteibacter caeruleilacunae]
MLTVMEFQLRKCTLRPWTIDDAESLARHANNENISGSLRDDFPHPYTIGHAREWLNNVINDEQNIVLAIEVDGEAVGSIGVFLYSNIYCKSAEIRYWLSEPYWGQGITSGAVKAVTKYAFNTLDIVRVQVCVFANNIRSMKVLRNAGYHLEAIRRNAIFKNNELQDEHLYVMLHEKKEVSE